MVNLVNKYENIIDENTIKKISSRYHRITKAINREFWGTNSDKDNSLYVGSYGRHTAIKTGDIDILVSLPREKYNQFDSYAYNGQSKLLQAVRDAINITYPNSYVKADGQIIKIDFSDGIKFEILPAFKTFNLFYNNQVSYEYADTNMGGHWKSTNPKAEQEVMRQKNKFTNGLFYATCQHIRYIRDNNYKSYHLAGIAIDSFVYNAIDPWQCPNSQTDNVAIPGQYEKHLLEYFNNRTKYSNLITAPGSFQKLNIENSIECLEKILKEMAL